MEPTPLYDVWDYTDVDRAFWDAHLADWLPERLIDAHSHLLLDRLRLVERTEEKKRQYWVNELELCMDAETAEHCDRVAWLEHGQLVDIGPPERVLEPYRASVVSPTDAV